MEIINKSHLDHGTSFSVKKLAILVTLHDTTPIHKHIFSRKPLVICGSQVENKLESLVVIAVTYTVTMVFSNT